MDLLGMDPVGLCVLLIRSICGPYMQGELGFLSDFVYLDVGQDVGQDFDVIKAWFICSR